MMCGRGAQEECSDDAQTHTLFFASSFSSWTIFFSELFAPSCCPFLAVASSVSDYHFFHIFVLARFFSLFHAL